MVLMLTLYLDANGFQNQKNSKTQISKNYAVYSGMKVSKIQIAHLSQIYLTTNCLFVALKRIFYLISGKSGNYTVRVKNPDPEFRKFFELKFS